MRLPRSRRRSSRYGAGVAPVALAMPVLTPIPQTRLARTLRALALLFLLFSGAFLLVAASEARRLRIDRKELVSPDVPDRFDGACIVFVADIHAGPQLGSKRIASLVDAVNELNADVLILGGDYVGGKLGGAEIFYPEAARLKASLGRYAVLGNHDIWEGAERSRRGLEDAGITLLENASACVSRDGQSIAIAGVEDLYTGHPDAKEAGKALSTSDFSVLVSHNPDVFGGQIPEMPGIWDLALSGHTHGGQVMLYGPWTRLLPKRMRERARSGWFVESGVPVLVSNGVGTVTAPLRFFAEPEIHVITLRRGTGAASGVHPAHRHRSHAHESAEVGTAAASQA